MVAVKGSQFPVVNSSVTEIYQRALLCTGNEETLIDCSSYEDGIGRLCPTDHSEDAGVKCNGTSLKTIPFFSLLLFSSLPTFSLSYSLPCSIFPVVYQDHSVSLPPLSLSLSHYFLQLNVLKET